MRQLFAVVNELVRTPQLELSQNINEMRTMANWCGRLIGACKRHQVF